MCYLRLSQHCQIQKKYFPTFGSEESYLCVGTTPRHASALPFTIHFYETRNGLRAQKWYNVHALNDWRTRSLDFALAPVMHSLDLS